MLLYSSLCGTKGLGHALQRVLPSGPSLFFFLLENTKKLRQLVIRIPFFIMGNSWTFGKLTNITVFTILVMEQDGKTALS